MTDWAKLNTEKGKATWVPDALDALRGDDSERRDRALRRFAKRLFKGAKWHNAAPPVVSALVDLVLEGVPERHRILRVLATLVAVRPGRYLVEGFDFADAPLKKEYARGTAKKVHAALWKHSDSLVALLDDGDARVRAAAGLVLLFDGRDVQRTAELLESALANEDDASTRATLVHVLGRIRTEALESLDDDDLVVSGLTMLARVDSTSSSDDLDRLIPLIRSAPLDPDEVPLDGGRVDMLVARVVEARVGNMAAAQLLVAAMSERHDLDEEWAAGVLELGLRVRKDLDAPFVIGSRVRPLASFDDAQRTLLEKLSEHPWRASFSAYEVPHRLRDRRRWLGLDEPGVLEKMVSVEIDGDEHEIAVWQWIAHLQAQKAERFDALEAHLDPVEVLHAMAEVAMGAYGLRSLRPQALAERAASVGERARDWAHEFVEDLASAVERDRGASWSAFGTVAAIKPGHPIAGVALEILLAAGETIEEHLDALIPPSSEALVAHISPTRCEAIILRSLERFDRAHDLRTANLSWVVGPMTPALARSPTPAVAARLRELRDRLGTTGGFEDVRALDAAIELVELS